MSTHAPTKKSRIPDLYEEGLDIETIAEILDTTPSYVANTLVASGRSVDYHDLYTTTRGADRYARVFYGALRFKNLEAARESVDRIDHLYRQFQREKDRRGMHHAQLIALTGKNRAEGIGKYREASLFSDWLKAHLDDTPQMEDNDARSD